MPRRFNLVKIGKLTAGIVLGNVIAERFILRASDEDAGFVTVRDGVGMDEVARALAIIVATMMVDRVVPG